MLWMMVIRITLLIILVSLLMYVFRLAITTSYRKGLIERYFYARNPERCVVSKEARKFLNSLHEEVEKELEDRLRGYLKVRGRS